MLANVSECGNDIFRYSWKPKCIVLVKTFCSTFQGTHLTLNQQLEVLVEVYLSTGRPVTSKFAKFKITKYNSVVPRCG